MPSSWSWARTEGTVCLVAAWAQSLFFSVGHLSVFWNMLSVFEGRGVFQIVMVPREHCACASHMWNVSVCAVQRLQCTRVSSSLCCHWCTEFQLCFCWLAAFSWIQPSVYQPASTWVCLRWVSSSMFRGKMDDFSSNVPSLPSQTYRPLADSSRTN